MFSYASTAAKGFEIIMGNESRYEPLKWSIAAPRDPKSASRLLVKILAGVCIDHVRYSENGLSGYMSDMRRKRKVWLCLHGCRRFYTARKSITIFCTFIAIKWFCRRQEWQSAADYHYLLVFDKPSFFRAPIYLR